MTRSSPGPALLFDSHTDHCGLDRLDLVTKVGNGRTAMAWTARWNRAGAEAASDRFTCSPLLTGEREPPLAAKVVSARYAASIAREYFVHTSGIPLTEQEYHSQISGELNSILTKDSRETIFHSSRLGDLRTGIYWQGFLLE